VDTVRVLVNPANALEYTMDVSFLPAFSADSWPESISSRPVFEDFPEDFLRTARDPAVESIHILLLYVSAAVVWASFFIFMSGMIEAFLFPDPAALAALIVAIVVFAVFVVGNSLCGQWWRNRYGNLPAEDTPVYLLFTVNRPARMLNGFHIFGRLLYVLAIAYMAIRWLLVWNHFAPGILAFPAGWGAGFLIFMMGFFFHIIGDQQAFH
jgi:hypothetical protein